MNAFDRQDLIHIKEDYAKRISNQLKIKLKKLDNDMAINLINEQDYLQQNLTNKLIRTMLNA